MGWVRASRRVNQLCSRPAGMETQRGLSSAGRVFKVGWAAAFVICITVSSLMRSLQLDHRSDTRWKIGPAKNPLAV